MLYNSASDIIKSMSNLTRRLARLERSSGAASTPVAITTSYTAGANNIVLADATGGAITVTLPPAQFTTQLEVKRLNAGANAVTIIPDPGDVGALIDGASSKVLSTQYASYTVISDGTNWWVI